MSDRPAIPSPSGLGATIERVLWPIKTILDNYLEAQLAKRARLDQAQTFTGAQRWAYKELASTGNLIRPDMRASNNFSHTLVENTTLATPIGIQPGQAGVIVFKQHASSPKTIAFSAFWKFPGGTVPSLTATTNAVDVFGYTVSPDGLFATCELKTDVK